MLIFQEPLFPYLSASQGSDSLLVPHFNIGQTDINLVGPQSRGWKGANHWESKVGDGWWEEVLKGSCTVKCPVGGSSGTEWMGRRADEEKLAPIHLNKKDGTMEPAC